MVVERIAVVEMEFPSGAEPGVEMDLELVERFFVDVVFIEAIEAVVGLELEFPERV